MNVFILAQYFPPDIGGASTRAFNVAKGLKKMGCNVKVVTAFPHYPLGNIPSCYKGKAFMFETIEDIQLIRVWIPSLPHNSVINRLILHICFIFSSLFALLFESKIDVIFAANPNMFCFFPALIYSFAFRKPIIRNVDDLWPEVFYIDGIVKSKFLQKILDLVTWFTYSVPIKITPISNAYKLIIIKKYRIKKEKIHTIEVGVDLNYIKKCLKYKNKNNLYQYKEKFTIIYSGILGTGYDFKAVLKSAIILSKYKSILFIIRGIGEKENEIKNMIKLYNIENVKLYTKLVPKKDLISILSIADAFLLPMKSSGTSYEGLPTKIFEYQALSKPIICCSSGESARYIKFTNSGIVIKPNDPSALASTILSLYHNREIAIKLGYNGLKYVENHLTVEKIGEKMYKVFSSNI